MAHPLRRRRGFCDGPAFAPGLQVFLNHRYSSLTPPLPLEEGVGKVGKRILKDGPFPMAQKAGTAKRPAARRKPRISEATRKLYQQQGRYMAALRNLSLEQRARIKAIREKSGVRKAIAAARSRLAEQRFVASQSKDSDQRRKRSGNRRSYPARPDPKPDKHGGSGAGRQQGGSGVGREHG
jgi:hypothetical protein